MSRRKRPGLVPIAEKVDIIQKSITKYQSRINDISKGSENHMKTVKQLEKDLKVVRKGSESVGG